MIQPGLERISRLLANTPLTWKAIHVAGTNGKGSICAAVSGMLHAVGIRCGRFTSPHLIDRWDCINIDERPVSKQLFQKVENDVIRFDHEQNIKASEFELLTATAFHIFNREKIDYAVVEVGMGGLQDATNIIRDPVVTVISKIGLDHQNFLGNTIEEIAAQKAGIIKPKAPVIVDGNNSNSVLKVIEQKAHGTQSDVIIRKRLPKWDSKDDLWQEVLRRNHHPHQAANLTLAFHAVVEALKTTSPNPPSPSILGTLPHDHWPGRTQQISLSQLTNRKNPVLLDGAHNLGSARVLQEFIPSDRPITWLLSLSHGKDVQSIFSQLLKPNDSVITVEFGPVDGMPWVQPMSSHALLEAVSRITDLADGIDGGRDVLSAVRKAVEIADEGDLVVTGSLYLISDVLRLRRDHSPESEMPQERPKYSLEDFQKHDVWQWDE